MNNQINFFEHFDEPLSKSTLKKDEIYDFTFTNIHLESFDYYWCCREIVNACERHGEMLGMAFCGYEIKQIDTYSNKVVYHVSSYFTSSL